MDAPATPGGSSQRSLGWRLSFGGLLCLTMGVGPFVLYTLSVLAPLITRDLGLSRTELGGLVTISFAIATLTSVSSGGMTDRLGNRRALVVLHGLTAVSLIGLALGPTYWWLAAATALAGFSQSPSNPVTNRLIGQQVPAGRRGTLLGVKQSGVQMSQFFAGAALPSMALLLGWRGAAAASIAFVVLALVLTYKLVPAEVALPRTGAGSHARPPLPAVVPWLAVYGFLTGIVIQGGNVYLPLFSFEALGFGPQLAGATAGVVGGIGILGRILWGRRAERAATAVGPMLAIAVLSIVAVTSFLLSIVVGGPLLWFGATLFALSALSSTVVLMMTVVRSIPSASTGRASGQVMLGVYSGFMTGPVVFGAVVDATDSYEAGWLLLLACSVAATVLCLVWRGRASSGALDRSQASE